MTEDPDRPMRHALLYLLYPDYLEPIGRSEKDRIVEALGNRLPRKLEKKKRDQVIFEMKNITVSVEDEVYHRARMWAAERRTSVSAMVRQMLADVAEEETPFEKLRREERELRDRLRSRGVRFAAADRLSRDALHDRHALR